jgi:hypothetical protein
MELNFDTSYEIHTMQSVENAVFIPQVGNKVNCEIVNFLDKYSPRRKGLAVVTDVTWDFENDVVTVKLEKE